SGAPTHVLSASTTAWADGGVTDFGLWSGSVKNGSVSLNGNTGYSQSGGTWITAYSVSTWGGLTSQNFSRWITFDIGVRDYRQTGGAVPEIWATGTIAGSVSDSISLNAASQPSGSVTASISVSGYFSVGHYW